MVKQLLVYGSLRKGQRAHRSLQIRHAEFIEEVRLPGYEMFKLGWFPGIKPCPDNKDGIVGELYEVPDHLWDELIQHLDFYEGYFPDNKERSLFVRKEIEVNERPTTFYEFNGKVGEWCTRIPTGDWLHQDNDEPIIMDGGIVA